MVIEHVDGRTAPLPRRRFRRLLLPSAALAVVVASGGSAAVVLTGADSAPAPLPPSPVPSATAAAIPAPVIPEVPGVSRALGVPEVRSTPETPRAPEASDEPDAAASAPIEAPAVSAPRAAARQVTTEVVHDVSNVDLIPPPALAAYLRTEAVMAQAAPRCHLDWSVVAAIGQLLTDHGRRGGDHTLGGDGAVRPAITGLVIRDERGRRVPDSDGGELDGDRHHDRAVGPMLLAPEAWRDLALDADMDGKRDPQDIDDASLGVAVQLCMKGGDLRRPRDLAKALRRINADPEFVRAVPRVAAEYAAGIAAPQQSIPIFAGASAAVVQAVSTSLQPSSGASSGSKSKDGKSKKGKKAKEKEDADDPADQSEADGSDTQVLTESEEAEQPLDQSEIEPAEDTESATTETESEPEPSPEPEPTTAPAPAPEPEPTESEDPESPTPDEDDTTCDDPPEDGTETCPTDDTTPTDGESTDPTG